MATHHEQRTIQYIARDVESLAASLEQDAKRLRDYAALLKAVENDSKPLDATEKFNIRSNTRRVIFDPMRSAGYAVSVETLLYALDRMVEGEG
jgi:hypothetical protein